MQPAGARATGPARMLRPVPPSAVAPPAAVQAPSHAADLRSLQVATLDLLEKGGMPAGLVDNFRFGRPRRGGNPPCLGADLRLADDLVMTIAARGADGRQEVADHIEPAKVARRMSDAMLKLWRERNGFLSQVATVRLTAAEEAERAACRNVPQRLVEIVPAVFSIYDTCPPHMLVVRDQIGPALSDQRFATPCWDVRSVRGGFRNCQRTLMQYAERRAELAEVGAFGEIDGVALAALKAANIDPVTAIEAMMAAGHYWIEMGEPRLRLTWDTGTILSSIDLAPDVKWDRGCVRFLKGSRPPGRWVYRQPITDIVSFPLLRSDMLIQGVHSGDRYTEYWLDMPLALFGACSGKVTWLGEASVARGEKAWWW